MTAEKILKENGINFPDWSDENDVINAMIEFAKYHVSFALLEASNNLQQTGGQFNSDYEEQKRKIYKTSYLKNIL